jgi:Tfp pilus assembly protein PilF
LLLLSACAAGQEENSAREVTLLLDKGRAYLQRDNAEMALLSLQRAQQLQPNQVEVLTLLGLAYDRVDRPLQALESLQAAQRLQTAGGDLNNNLGVACLRVHALTCQNGMPAEECRRLLEQAGAALQRALTDPALRAPEEVYYNLALLARQRGEEEQKYLELLHRALAIRPHFLAARLALAESYRQVGRAALERQQLRQALAAHPDQLEVLHRLVESYRWSDKGAGRLLDEVTGQDRLELRTWLSRIRALSPGSEWAQRAAQRMALLDEK